MPWDAKSICPRCKVKVEQPGLCDACRIGKERSRKGAHARGYNHHWRKRAKLYLQENPLCAECEQQGILTAATVVDHKVPHKGDMSLFWDEDNWQSLCKTCHDRKTATEDGGFMV